MPVNEHTQKAIEEAFAFDPGLGQKVLAARSVTTGDKWWQPNGKGKEGLKTTWVAFSMVAFFLVFFLYFYRRMWKKGLVMLFGSIGLSIILAMLGVSDVVMTAVGWAWCFYAGLTYYCDCYRKYVKKEDFWF